MLATVKGALRLSLLILLAASCNETQHTPLTVSDMNIFEPMPGRTMSVGYLTLGNDSATDVSVSRVTSPQFAAVEIHETAVIDGVARMRDVPELTIPANSSITLRSGGLHLMLMRPVTRSTEVRLSFYDGENLLLEATTNLKSRSQ